MHSNAKKIIPAVIEISHLKKPPVAVVSFWMLFCLRVIGSSNQKRSVGDQCQSSSSSTSSPSKAILAQVSKFHQHCGRRPQAHPLRTPATGPSIADAGHKPIHCGRKGGNRARRRRYCCPHQQPHGGRLPARDWYEVAASSRISASSPPAQLLINLRKNC